MQDRHGEEAVFGMDAARIGGRFQILSERVYL